MTRFAANAGALGEWEARARALGLRAHALADTLAHAHDRDSASWLRAQAAASRVRRVWLALCLGSPDPAGAVEAAEEAGALVPAELLEALRTLARCKPRMA